MSKWDPSKAKNPFTYREPLPDYDVTPKPHEYTNPLKAFFEEYAPKILIKPKAKRTPLAPIRTAQWDPASGMKGARYPTFVPLPLPGTTPVTSAQARVPRGEKGLNTMVNLIIDTSGSMKTDAATWRGYVFGRWEVARLCAISMVAQCQLGEDDFAVYSFSHYGVVEWGGPSSDYGGCIDWMSSYHPGEITAQGRQGRSFYPALYPQGTTDIASGLRVCINTMLKNRIDKAVTIVLTDITGPGIFDAAMSSSPVDNKCCDAVLRSYGPVYYITIGNYSSSPVMKSHADNFNQQLDAFYGRKIRPSPAHYEAINPNDADSAIHLCGSIAQMAYSVSS